MSEYQTIRIKCADDECRVIFDVQARRTGLKQSGFIECPECYEEMYVSDRGHPGDDWAVKSETRIIVGKW